MAEEQPLGLHCPGSLYKNFLCSSEVPVSGQFQNYTVKKQTHYSYNMSMFQNAKALPKCRSKYVALHLLDFPQ